MGRGAQIELIRNYELRIEVLSVGVCGMCPIIHLIHFAAIEVWISLIITFVWIDWRLYSLLTAMSFNVSTNLFCIAKSINNEQLYSHLIVCFLSSDKLERQNEICLKSLGFSFEKVKITFEQRNRRRFLINSTLKRKRRVHLCRLEASGPVK